MNRYLIELRGQVDIADMNAISPHQITLVRKEPTATWIQIDTDQAGMVGVLVHLHRIGMGLLSVRYLNELTQQEANHERSAYFAA